MTNPLFPSSHQSIVTQMVAGRHGKATELCLEALRDHPDDADLHLLLGLCDEQRTDASTALERLRVAQEKDRQHPLVRFHLGRLLIAQGEFEPARSELRRCVEIDPNQAGARTLLARLEWADGRVDSAMSGLKTALRADEDHVPARLTLAGILLDQGDLEGANEQASHALKVAPEDPQAQLTMARVLSAQGFSGFAERCLDNAAELDPGNPAIKVVRAGLLLRSHRFREAMAAVAEAEQAGYSDPQLDVLKGRALVGLNRLSDARKVYEALLERRADREVVLNLADVYVRMVDASALEALPDRLAENDEHLRIWLAAQAAVLSGRMEAGADLASLLTDIDEAELQLRARLLLARLAARNGATSELANHLAPFLQPHQIAPAIVWQAAEVCRNAGDHDLAVSLLDALLERSGLAEDDQRRSRAMRLDQLDRGGRYQEAAEAFQAASWQSPFLGDQAYLSGAGAAEPPDLSPLETLDWASLNDTDKGTGPVFTYGWPYSGRDLVVMVLGSSRQLSALPVADWPARRQALHLPVRPAQLAGIRDGNLRLMQKRYLRGASNRDNQKVLEPAALMPMDLPHFARVFPDSVVLVPRVEERYLELQWRLAGYRQVPTMLKVWRRDEQTLARLRELLPVRFVEFDLAGLLEDPVRVVSALCQALGLSYDTAMEDLLRELANQRGYRPPRHWQHYFSTE